MQSIERIKASDGSGNANLATVQNSRSPGASTIVVDTVLGINVAGFEGSMGTPHTFTDPITSETITVISEATAVDFTGHVDGSNLEIDDIAPGYTDDGSEVGDIIIIRPTTQYADNLAEVLEVSHNDDGTLKVANGGSIEDENGNEQLKFSTTSSAVNEVTVKNAATGNAPQLQATGGDTNIDINLVPKGTGNIKKAGNNIDWWEEIGRTTLGVAGDTISVASLPARKYLKVRINLIPTGGTINPLLRLNNDSGNNYNYRYLLDWASAAGAVSQSSITLDPGTLAQQVLAELIIDNIAAREKMVRAEVVGSNVAGAGNQAKSIEVAGKWANTADAISRLDIVNGGGTGDFAIGSEVVILGHN